MDGISRSRGWDKEIPHGVLPMEQLVLRDEWARKIRPSPAWREMINDDHEGLILTHMINS